MGAGGAGVGGAAASGGGPVTGVSLHDSLLCAVCAQTYEIGVCQMFLWSSCATKHQTSPVPFLVKSVQVCVMLQHHGAYLLEVICNKVQDLSGFMLLTLAISSASTDSSLLLSQGVSNVGAGGAGVGGAAATGNVINGDGSHGGDGYGGYGVVNEGRRLLTGIIGQVCLFK